MNPNNSIFEMRKYQQQKSSVTGSSIAYPHMGLVQVAASWGAEEEQNSENSCKN